MTNRYILLGLTRSCDQQVHNNNNNNNNSARAHIGNILPYSLSISVFSFCVTLMVSIMVFMWLRHPVHQGGPIFVRCSTSCMRSFSIHYTVWLAPKFFCFICCCNSHISIFFFVPSLKYLNFAPYKRKRYIHSDCEWHTDWWGVLIRLQHTARSSTPPCLLLNSGLACRLTVYLKLQQN